VYDPEVSDTVPAARRAERFNSWSHFAGALLALAALVALVARALSAGDPARLLSFAVYGASLVALYTASSLYHALQGRPKAVFRKLDHLAIYLLIAGTYTPFALLKLRNPLGLTLLAVVWCLAALGCVLEFVSRRRVFSVALYLGMGWLALAVVRPLAQALQGYGLTWVLAGGALYTLGTVFYALDRRFPSAHGVFHVLVLAGSASHFVAVWVYLA
jgi:hemolysin III